MRLPIFLLLPLVLFNCTSINDVDIQALDENGEKAPYAVTVVGYPSFKAPAKEEWNTLKELTEKHQLPEGTVFTFYTDNHGAINDFEIQDSDNKKAEQEIYDFLNSLKKKPLEVDGYKAVPVRVRLTMPTSTSTLSIRYQFLNLEDSTL